jgi:5'-nucleotidase
MRILLTNDDGIRAEGMEAMERFLRSLPSVTQVITVAPIDGRSCCGHSVNSATPIAFSQLDESRFAVDGWPADCVRLAILHLQFKPDWVLSGINHGGNMGVDVWMSGTCSAAREATWLGYRAMALSQYRKPSVSTDWDVSAVRAWEVIDPLFDKPVPQRGFWNINLPAIEPHRTMPSPVECHLEEGPHDFTLEPHSEGVLYRSSYQNRPRTTGSDVDVCFSGRPSMTFCCV